MKGIFICIVYPRDAIQLQFLCDDDVDSVQSLPDIAPFRRFDYAPFSSSPCIKTRARAFGAIICFLLFNFDAVNALHLFLAIVVVILARGPVICSATYIAHDVFAAFPKNRFCTHATRP